MKIKVTEIYEIDVCELCGNRAEKNESFTVCDCCGRTYCDDCSGAHISRVENISESREYYICKVCHRNGATAYAGKELEKCALHESI